MAAENATSMGVYFDPKTDLSLVIAVLALLFSLLAIYIQRRRERYNATIEIAHRWTEPHMEEARQLLRAHTTYGKWKPIDRDGIATIGRDPKLDKAVGIVLNHLEIVSSGINKRVLDNTLAFSLYGDIILSTVYELGPYIESLREPLKPYYKVPPKFTQLTRREEAWRSRRRAIFLQVSAK
jgi:hypothetical protein